MEINHFFSSPVFILTDNTFQENVENLLSEIYQWRENDEVNVVRSNNGGWHSPTDIFNKEEPGLRRVCQMMINCFGRCTKAIAPEFVIENFDMKGEGWVNVSPQHGFNVPHDHPGYTWSGVYYVSLPEKKDPKSRSGNIELLDPRTNTAAMATDIARSSQYFSPKRTLTPQNGMILIFPSYLRHWVYPNDEETDRISMAFNFKYSPKSISKNVESSEQQNVRKKGSKAKDPQKSKKKK